MMTPLPRHHKFTEIHLHNQNTQLLNILYTNTCSLMNKLGELRKCINLYDLDVICIVETHLNDGILDAEIALPNFTSFRCDRSFKIGGDHVNDPSGFGGAVIYVRSRLNVNLVKSFVAPDSVAVSIKTYIGQIAIASIYRSQALTVTQNQQILSAIKSLCNSEKYSEIIITGDFKYE